MFRLYQNILTTYILVYIDSTIPLQFKMANKYGLAVINTIRTIDVGDNLSMIYESLDISLPSDVSVLSIKVVERDTGPWRDVEETETVETLRSRATHSIL